MNMGWSLSDEVSKLYSQAERDLQKEIDKLPGEAEKLAQQEVYKLTGVAPAPKPPMPQPAFITNLAAKYKVKPWMVWAGLAGAGFLVFYMMSPPSVPRNGRTSGES